MATKTTLYTPPSPNLVKLKHLNFLDLTFHSLSNISKPLQEIVTSLYEKRETITKKTHDLLKRTEDEKSLEVSFVQKILPKSEILLCYYQYKYVPFSGQTFNYAIFLQEPQKNSELLTALNNSQIYYEIEKREPLTALYLKELIDDSNSLEALLSTLKSKE